MTHVSYKVGGSDDALMRAWWQACLTRGRSEVRGGRPALSHSRLSRRSALEGVHSLLLIGNVGFQRASWSPKISYNSSGHPIKRPEKFPFWSPFGCVSFIAPEMKSRLSLFIYLFSAARAQFALLHYEDTTASPWFVCFLFQKKRSTRCVRQF